MRRAALSASAELLICRHVVAFCTTCIYKILMKIGTIVMEVNIEIFTVISSKFLVEDRRF